MDDAIIPVGISLYVVNGDVDKANAELARVSKQQASSMASVTNAAISEDTKRVTSAKKASTGIIDASKVANDAIAKHLKIRANEEKKIAALTTTELGKQYNERSKLVETYANTLKTTFDKSARAEIQSRLNVEKELRQIDARIYKSRSEVINSGAGAQYGILGLERIFKQIIPSTVGFGGPALIGSFSSIIAQSTQNIQANSEKAKILAGIYSGAMATGLSAVGAGMAFSVKQGLSMEDALAKLSAQSGITGNDLESLRLKAEKSAIAFRVEAPDAVDATRLTINALGLDLTKNIPLLEQMTTSVMTLAKASGLDAAQAADSASTAFNMFGHSIHDANAAEEFQKITNVLAAGARQARTQIPDLVQELSYVGPEAHKAGLSIEETISAMEALGHAGIKPEQVGAEFRAFIMQLEAGSKKAQDALGRLDLTFYDINPTTVGFSKSIHTLKEKLDEIYDPATKVGDATKRAAIEQEIFQRRTSSLAEAMFANVDVFDQYTQAVTGTHDAEDMASKMTHTLSQDFTGIWEKIKTEGIDAFYQYRSEIEKVPGVIDKEIPKLFALLDVLEKVGGSFYHVWQLAENLDNAIGMDRDPNSAVDKFYQNVDRALGLQNEHEKTIDAQQRIDAYNKAHALTQQQITEYTNRNAFMDSLGTSPFDANGNPIVTSSVATSGDAFDTKKKKGSAEHTAYEAALDRLRDAYSKRLTIIENSAKSEDDIKKAEQQAELDNLNAQLATELKFKQKTGETKEQIAKLKLTIRSEEYREEEKLQKEAEKADLKAWDEHLKRLAKANDDEEKLQERHAAKRREIETKLQDMQDASIEDKTQREIAQENTRYEREQKTILAQADGTKEMHDLIDKDLEMLEQEHWQKLKDITDEGATKSADSVNKLTESLRGLKNEANSAKEWGTVLSTGLLIAYDMLRESQSKAIAAPDSSWRRPAIPGIAGTGDWTQSLGKGNALDQLFPFHDTPGTLAQSSGKGTIPVGNGNYLVIGRGDDRLVREDKEATNIITYLRALQQYDSAQFEKDNRKKSLGLQATAIGQLLFQGNGLKSEILSMIHDGKSQSDIISALIHSGGNVRDYFAERVGEGIKEYAFKKPTEFALETALGAPIGGAAGKLAEATIGEFEEVADIPLSHAGKHIATYAAEKLAEHFGGEAAASAVFNAVPSFNDSPPFGQISGQKYIVGGAPDDMLIKGTSFVTMLAEGVTKGVNAAKITDFSQKTTEQVTKPLNIGDIGSTGASVGNLVGSIYSVAHSKSGTNSGAESLGALGNLIGSQSSMNIAGSLGASSSLQSAMGTAGGALGAVGQSVSGFQALSKITAHDKGTKSAGTALSAFAPMLGLIPGVGPLLSIGAELAGGALASYASGTDRVPKTGNYRLHEGERVLTRYESEMVRRSSSTASNRFHPQDIEALAHAVSRIKVTTDVQAIRTGGIQAANQLQTWE